MNSSAKRLHCAPRPGQQGQVTLLVAVLLLLVMFLTAFFMHRTMVLDQDIAGNHYRSIRANMTAEAGLELVSARLKLKSERDAVLSSDGRVYSGFTSGEDTHTYAIPASELGSLSSAPGDVSATVQLEAAGPDAPFSMLRITSRGCWQESGAAIAACTSCSEDCPTTAQISQVVAFVGALAGVPSAALTAKGNVDLGGSAITVTNTDPTTHGLTVHAGGTVSNHSDSNLVTLPGTPPTASVAPGDGELADVSPDAYFEKFFGLDKSTYKNSTDEVIVCGGVCNTSVAGKDGLILWVDVPEGQTFVLNAPTPLGSETEPVVLIVNGPLELRGSASIYGLVYSTSLLWDNTGGGTSQIFGAAIAEGSFTANGTPNPTYRGDILARLSGQTGRFVKIPGTWRDFPIAPAAP